MKTLHELLGKYSVINISRVYKNIGITPNRAAYLRKKDAGVSPELVAPLSQELLKIRNNVLDPDMIEEGAEQLFRTKNHRQTASLALADLAADLGEYIELYLNGDGPSQDDASKWTKTTPNSPELTPTPAQGIGNTERALQGDLEPSEEFKSSAEQAVNDNQELLENLDNQPANKLSRISDFLKSPKT